MFEISSVTQKAEEEEQEQADEMQLDGADVRVEVAAAAEDASSCVADASLDDVVVVESSKARLPVELLDLRVQLHSATSKSMAAFHAVVVAVEDTREDVGPSAFRCTDVPADDSSGNLVGDLDDSHTSDAAASLLLPLLLLVGAVDGDRSAE